MSGLSGTGARIRSEPHSGGSAARPIGMTTLPGTGGSAARPLRRLDLRNSLRRLHGESPAGRTLDLAWACFVLGMFVLMRTTPQQQTVPYHLIFVSFTLVYGFRLWTARTTIAVLTLLTVVSGAMFLDVYLSGRVTVDEVAEIPLMSMIVGAMAWHAHRAAGAQHRVAELAALEASRSERQRNFLRETAHAIRTPVTIARGNLELLQLGSSDEQLREDTNEVLHQLDRLHQLARRLLVIEAMQTSATKSPRLLDAGVFAAALSRRWAGAADREWITDCTARGQVLVDMLRLEEALDAMVENALRFTDPGDTIRISCRDDGQLLEFAVADSGPGIPAEDRHRVFERFFHRHPPGEEPGNGLGLALVAAVASSGGGSASAGGAPEGGALVTLRLPRA
jgi:signal transduction histidine kinase